MARVSDGVTSGAKIARAGYVANGFGAARTGEAVDRGNSSNVNSIDMLDADASQKQNRHLMVESLAEERGLSRNRASSLR